DAAKPIGSGTLLADQSRWHAWKLLRFQLALARTTATPGDPNACDTHAEAREGQRTWFGHALRQEVVERPKAESPVAPAKGGACAERTPTLNPDLSPSEFRASSPVRHVGVSAIRDVELMALTTIEVQYDHANGRRYPRRIPVDPGQSDRDRLPIGRPAG